ncbi:hypothetical protein N1F89_11670 [Aquibium sp. A9E412]|uniref:cell division protein FtsL n=1 Tax=Aquibium sp. A9E412 TaxID=2976767 RepID=UPI0025B07D56|nr:hypothetical protein [Aquibium sp. A9E412]MDN2566883.1 hypothetical protein [Aquibium sp. A9E412]
MFRTLDIVLIAVMVSAAAFTYTTKHEAENQLDRVRALQTAIGLEKDTIDVLKADWSLLTQPARLQRLTEVYAAELDLAPVEAGQIAELDDLPVRPMRIEDPTHPLGGIAATGQDPATTGSVVR